MNIFLMLFAAPCGSLVRSTIYFALGLQAVMQVCAFAEGHLLENPETVGLSTLYPLIEYINLSRVEITILKNQIEMLLAFVCFPFVFTGHVAMIFPVMYIQYVRVKYVASMFQKHTWKIFNSYLKENLPSGIYDNFLFQMIINRLISFGNLSTEEQA